jgi:hypothetical protein
MAHIEVAMPLSVVVRSGPFKTAVNSTLVARPSMMTGARPRRWLHPDRRVRPEGSRRLGPGHHRHGGRVEAERAQGVEPQPTGWEAHPAHRTRSTSGGCATQRRLRELLEATATTANRPCPAPGEGFG